MSCMHPPGRVCWVLLATLVAQAASATAPTVSLETISARVSLAGLDLATPAGIAAARERIASAADRLCRVFEDPRKADHAQTRAECYRQSVAEGLHQLTEQVATRTHVALHVPTTSP